MYLLGRKLHFISGFLVRNAGEIGLVLFLILILGLGYTAYKGEIKVEYIMASVAAFGGYGAFLTQQRAKMHEIIDKIDHEFDLHENNRKYFSKRLRNTTKLKWAPENDRVDGILDFFDTIGSLIRTGALSFTLADAQFAYWAIRYFMICSERIAEVQSHDEHVWESYRWFVEKIPKRHRGSTDEKALQLFIREEAQP